MPIDDPIYYVYERANGNFAGSGITNINNATYASTLTVPPDPPTEPLLRYDEANDIWIWWVPVS